jgi:hypothetical protein
VHAHVHVVIVKLVVVVGVVVCGGGVVDIICGGRWGAWWIKRKKSLDSK